MSETSNNNDSEPSQRGPGRPPDKDKRDAPADIFDAAERMFGSAGYEATSLRQIAGAANVDLSTVKYHYGDKANLFAEVYRRGHEALVTRIGPALRDLGDVETRQQLVEKFHDFVGIGLDFIHDETAFVRLTLYRILEDSEEIAAIEEEIEGVTIDILEAALLDLRERNLIRDIHVRSLIVLIMTGMPMWEVSAATNPHLIRTPDEPDTDWREEAHEFIHQVIVRTLIRDP